MIENPSKFHISKIIFLKKIGKVAKIYCAIKSAQKLGYKYVNSLALKWRLSPEASNCWNPPFKEIWSNQKIFLTSVCRCGKSWAKHGAKGTLLSKYPNIQVFPL